MKPRCRTAGGLQQLRYQVPYDITSSAVYPLLSPNGSNILICGHSAGLFIIWRGGRRLKPTKHVSNPTPAQDVMTIDDSDDEHSKPQILPPPDFEDEEEEFDPRNPYPSIVQTLDLPLGTGVIQLAVPPLSEAEKTHLKPAFLRENLLLTVGCTDGQIRVLTLPLAPPSEISKLRKSLVDKPELAMAGQGSWGERVISLKGSRTLPTAVSVAIAPRALTIERDDDDMEDADESETGWTVLVASGSADAGGKMLIDRVFADTDETALLETEDDHWRNVLLTGTPTALDIYAGADITSKIFPRVVVAEASSNVRIYQCTSEQPGDSGRFTASLCPSTTSSARITAVKLGLAGGLVTAVTNEGGWGVWDLNHLTEQATTEGISVVERFSYAGNLVTSSLVAAGQNGLSRQAQFKTLPAVTPHTRKVRQQALFDSSSSKPTQPAPTVGSELPGGITLTKTTHESGKGEDSSALFWYNDRGIFIQSLRAHHQGRIASQRGTSSALTLIDDPFSSSSGAAAQLKNLTVPDRASLAGGAPINVSPLLRSTDRTASVRSKAPEAVYVSERAVTFVGPPRLEDAKQHGKTNGVQNSQQEGEKRDFGRSSLLKRGELSLAGIEGMLNSMSNPVKRLSGRT